ncbi:putative 3-beta-hydroxysteroid-Delta(8),Delta(7)-isomerase [Triangularia setosa]|uniref:3-beta-hydroxysteroid-Delta(8),Delta(7)-isomerase n=1 Tax=Triangularia setosa TaxID=2587417 RepID=A0AAN6WC82_9PEZI|nr:putative 3-beta-hydroxysteroid-Delta(8),Delta(7)-isomerase [Podospora setosa]
MSSTPYSTLDGVSHPYYPTDATVPFYAANTTPLLAILFSFAGLIAGFVFTCLAASKHVNPKLQRSDLAVISWFALCGFLHLFFEGYFVLNHKVMAGSQDLFAQLWKEYGLSDSRYLTADPFMIWIETLTFLIWGPLSLLTVYLITAEQNAPRHITQIVVCIGHLYGVALYYGTCHYIEKYQGLRYSRPEWVYYWGYYAGMNAPWGVVPLLLLWQSAGEIKRVFGRAEREERVKKGL